MRTENTRTNVKTQEIVSIAECRKQRKGLVNQKTEKDKLLTLNSGEKIDWKTTTTTEI